MSRAYAPPCIHCKQPYDCHLKRRCLFAPTRYEPMTVETFEERLFHAEWVRLSNENYLYVQKTGRHNTRHMKALQALAALCIHPRTRPHYALQNARICSLCFRAIPSPL